MEKALKVDVGVILTDDFLEDMLEIKDELRSLVNGWESRHDATGILIKIAQTLPQPLRNISELIVETKMEAVDEEKLQEKQQLIEGMIKLREGLEMHQRNIKDAITASCTILKEDWKFVEFVKKTGLLEKLDKAAEKKKEIDA